MAKDTKVCPECKKEVTQIMKKSGLCRGCNMKAVKAKKAAAPEAPPAETAETTASEPTEMSRGPRTRGKRKSLEDRRSFAADPNAVDPNFAYYLATEDPRKPGRVQELEAAGYEVVTNRDVEYGEGMTLSDLTHDSKGLGSAVSKPVGNGATGYLMRRPKDMDDEDRAYIETKAKHRETGVFGSPKGENQYRPKSVSTEVGSALYQTKEE
jgi:hypothetical protein